MFVSSLGRNSSYLYSMQRLYSKLSSGNRINSAADDPAGLAVARLLERESTGYRAQNRNITDSKSLLDTADGALSKVSDSLSRMKELALQSSNGTYSDTERAAMQSEIDHLKDQIDNVSQGTRFNGIQVFKGSYQLSGSNQRQKFDVSTDNLGVADFDVMGDFDVSDIDRAMDSVDNMRASIGSAGNGMTHTMNSNANADINIQSAQSMMESADMERAIMDLRNSMLEQQTRLFSWRRTQMQIQGNSSSLLDLRA